MTSFDKVFQQSTTTYYQNTRSASSFQLRKHDFKTEKYGQFSVINKCLSDWNQLQKYLKTNFKDIKHSELKNYCHQSSPQTVQNIAKLRKKKLRKSASFISFYLLYFYLSLNIYLSLSSIFSISYFFLPVPRISVL